MNIVIANDHGGYDLKKAIMVHLMKQRHHVINEGSDSREIVRYPYYASRAAAAVSTGAVPFGILICNTGIGMSMIANKYPGVRAALVTSEETARLTRQHNDANILCLGGKFVDADTACRIVDIFLETPFEGGRHEISLGLIAKAEAENFGGGRFERFNAEFPDGGALYTERDAPQRILLDTDMLTDCDDLAAIAMLHRLEMMGLAKTLAITVSSAYPKSAAVVDALNTYYGRGALPVGAPKNGRGVYLSTSCFLDALAAEFVHAVADNDDAPDAVRVMRRALAESPDESVRLVTIGYMTNVEALLDSAPDDLSPDDGMTLVRHKVCEWICMGGNFPDDPAIDNVNFKRDPIPALRALRRFPRPITFAGREIGHNVFVGDRFHALPAENPLRRAYALHRGRYGDNWDHHTADPCAVLYAVTGLSDLFAVQTGSMTLQDDCSFTWDPDVPSHMAYLLQKGSRALTARRIEALIL